MSYVTTVSNVKFSEYSDIFYHIKELMDGQEPFIFKKSRYQSPKRISVINNLIFKLNYFS
jgi:hypothetical protein